MLTEQETFVAKLNYHHARKQKELARKARQQEKQRRRSPRPSTGDENLEASQSDTSTAPSGESSGSGA